MAAALSGLVVVLVMTMTVTPTLAGAAGSAIGLGFDLPSDARLAALAERSTVHAADGGLLAVLHDEVDRRIVTLDQIPEHVRQAVLAAEDRKFYEHPGYDVEGIVRAVVANARAREVQQGGSTITQQLAKSLVGAERSMERKLSELVYAVALEQEFSKDELLEQYLNQVYLGAGSYGFAAAAEEYFHTSPEELTIDQAALLAGVIRSPSRLEPRRNPDGALARRNQVLRGMAAEGFISHEEAGRLAAQPLGVQPPRPREVSEPYVVEAVKREFFANPVFGETRQDRINLMFTGGLEIHTTVNPRFQQAADEIIAEFFPPDSGPTAAIAAVDPRNGKVLALHSGADFAEDQFDLASQGRRQPGSAFKPFVLAAALEHGLPLTMTLEGSGPIEFEMPGGQDPWRVSNYRNARYGRLSLIDALVRSVNTAFAQLVMVLGAERAADVAERLGINMRAANGEFAYPAIALGGLERGVTPLEMASAYGVFATAGQRVAPHVINRVVDRHGRELYSAAETPEGVIDPPVAGAMVEVMQQVVQRGTARAARITGWEAAGKTGTTQNNADAWFVGFTPVLSTAVWMGHPEGQVPMRGMTGGSVPARMWQRFMTVALDGVDPVPFPDTGDLAPLRSGERVAVPDVVGMSETEALSALADAKLVGLTRSVDARRPRGTVVWQSPRAGNETGVGSQVTIGVSTGNAPPPPPPEPEPEPAPEEPPPPQPEPEPEPEPESQLREEPAARPSPAPAPAPAPPEDQA